MVLSGLQKLTLLDYPGHVACTLFTAGCDFRCPFCHNASLVYRDKELETYSEDDIINFLRKRKGTLDGVCITGGEPLLHRDIAPFIARIKEEGYPVKLDTNGSYPERLRELIQNNLIDKVAMDIKNTKEKYGITVGIPDYDISGVEKSVEMLLHGDIEYEFRTTVTKNFHTTEDMSEIARWIQGTKAYFLQGFVDSGELIDSEVEGHSPETMHEMLTAVQKYIPAAQLRGVE